MKGHTQESIKVSQEAKGRGKWAGRNRQGKINRFRID